VSLRGRSEPVGIGVVTRWPTEKAGLEQAGSGEAAAVVEPTLASG
jgi:hypothetical protein